MTTDKPYMPSEADVRARYVFAGLPDRATTDQAERARAREVPEFDRWLAAHDAQARRDAALHEKQRIAGEVRLWASINEDMGYTESAETLTRAAGDIDRIPEETP